MLRYFDHVFLIEILSGFKIGPLLRKLWAKTFQSLKAQGHKNLWGTGFERVQGYEGREGSPN